MADEKKENFELLQCQAHVWKHIFNYIDSMSLKCAVKLGIPEVIHGHGKPISLSELNSALAIHPSKTHCIPRLMRVLVHSGFIAMVKINSNGDEQRYILTDASQLLLKENPFNLTPILLVNLNLAIDSATLWHCLSDWLRNDDPTPFITAHRVPIWDHTAKNHKICALFNESMANDSKLVWSVLFQDAKEMFQGVDSVVDVGGGNGTTAKLIAEVYPKIQCTWVLHNWKDEDCLNILSQCKKAIKRKLIIIDMVIKEDHDEENDRTEIQFLFDILMMVYFNGKERTEKEWAKLFAEGGFSGYKIIPVLGVRSVIEVFP